MVVMMVANLVDDHDDGDDDDDAEPGRLLVVVLHPPAHAREAGLIIGGLTGAIRLKLHPSRQESKMCLSVCGYRSALGSGWSGTELIAMTL